MTGDRGRACRRRREAWGRLAEHAAAWVLRLRGYRILARRYRTPFGEIDLIVQRGRVVAFVEVKARERTAAALEALTRQQQHRTGRAAAVFLQRYPRHAGYDLRFDLITVRPWRLPRHLPNAWQL